MTRKGQRGARARKPAGYWDDPATLRRELEAFAAEHGMPGRMPSWAQLHAAGRVDLTGAIDTHGGQHAVARALGLDDTRLKKARGYWQDFVNVEVELRAFIACHGEPGVLPAASVLRRHGCHQLADAIVRHGGFEAVARRLKLRRPGAPRPLGYWQQFDNVARELRVFIREHGQPGVMPGTGALRAWGCTSLLTAVTHYGGVAAVAERLGLRRPGAKRPAGYWGDFANLAREVRAFLGTRGGSKVMPSATALAAAGRYELTTAIGKHGGFPEVARRLGLKRPRDTNPPHYYDDFKRLARDLRACQREHGWASTVMPAQGQLRSAGRHDLATAVLRHGGHHAVAARMKLRPQAGQDRPRGYWGDFANVDRELRAYMAAHECGETVPTPRELARAGLRGLAGAIRKHGGRTAVARRMALDTSHARPPTGARQHAQHRARRSKPQGYWHDLGNIERELRAFVAEHRLPVAIPTWQRLLEAGRSDLVAALRKAGGRQAVGERLGLECAPTRKPAGYWQDDANLERELRQFIARHGQRGSMPGVDDVLTHGRADLHGAIKLHGGYVAVGERLGLKHAAAHRPYGYWQDFGNLAGELRAYVRERGRGRLMPSVDELRRARRTDLVWAIVQHGGRKAVAGRLGLPMPANLPKPHGYWSDFANLEREVRAFMERHNPGDVLPSCGDLVSAGRGDLASAIAKHGGFRAVARRLDLYPASEAPPLPKPLRVKLPRRPRPAPRKRRGGTPAKKPKPAMRKERRRA